MEKEGHTLMKKGERVVLIWRETKEKGGNSGYFLWEKGK